ncbi:MAG: protein-L-isoaspartate(D-aspartate) O-methyltransferase [Rhodospirillales bacterium]|nr:protein-L-isoaspartate(D-aspartate) O-methyltransferase [Rhodospirillales bacterium]
MNDPSFADAHRRLMEEIEAEARETAHWTGRVRYAERVMMAMASVPRHEFVADWQWPVAYANCPLAIGHGQTISQPYIVALMTDLLDLDAGSRVLEIGTGCGYQAAVLASVAGRVYSVEVIPELADTARRRLAHLGYDNVQVRVGDGYTGWSEQAPFDGIIVTAAPPEIPGALADQLVIGGRLVIPVGTSGQTQFLYRCVREPDGTLTNEQKLPVAFVPMVPGLRPS